MIVRGGSVAPVGAGSVGPMSALRTSLDLPMRAVLALVVALAVLALGADPSVAHGGAGVIEIDVPEERGDMTIGLRIRLTYEDDEHPAAEDEVGEITVEGTGPDGETFGPESSFDATEVPGVYAAELTFPAPGTWEVTVSSDEPAATATTTIEIADASSPVAEEPADDDQDDVTADTVSAVEGEGTAQIVERGSGGDGPTPLLLTLLVVGVLVVALIVGGVVLRRRGRSS
jgi:hypothetical protein